MNLKSQQFCHLRPRDKSLEKTVMLGKTQCKRRRNQRGQFSSVSHVGQFAAPWNAAHQASLSFTNSRNLFKLMSNLLVISSNYLILCCPLLLPPSIFPSIRVFSNKSVICIRWPKYWSFSFNISLSKEYSGVICFRMGWLDLLEVQGTLKSLFQHHSSKILFLWFSTFLQSNFHIHT